MYDAELPGTPEAFINKEKEEISGQRWEQEAERSVTGFWTRIQMDINGRETGVVGYNKENDRGGNREKSRSPRGVEGEGGGGLWGREGGKKDGR